MPDPLYDDPETPEQAESRRRAEFVAALDADAIRFLADAPLGRHFLRRIMDWTGFLAASPTPFREGQRDVWDTIMKLMDSVDPTMFPSLLAEQAAEEARRRG